MQDHDSGEGFGGVYLGGVEGCLVCFFDEEGGVVADYGFGAVVLVISVCVSVLFKSMRVDMGKGRSFGEGIWIFEEGTYLGPATSRTQ